MTIPKTGPGNQRTTCASAAQTIRSQLTICREGAADVLNEYFEEIGGRPKPNTAKGQKRKGRPSGVKSESGTPASTTKRAKQEKAWTPPPGSWEHDVSHCDTVEESVNPQTGKLERFAYLVWRNQKKTQHPLQHTYQKCPQKVRTTTHCVVEGVLTKHRCSNIMRATSYSHIMMSF